MVSLTRAWATGEEQVANANDDFVDLSPVSETPAATTFANWRALMSIGASNAGIEEEQQ